MAPESHTRGTPASRARGGRGNFVLTAVRPTRRLPLLPATPEPMRNLLFRFFEDGRAPSPDRILMFYSFETENNLSRSGILHYHLGEGRFVGPRHDQELTSAALEFLGRAGRVSAA